MNIGPQGPGLPTPGTEGGAEAAARVRAWCGEFLAVEEQTTIMVAELRCSEPGCPRLQTSIALLDDCLETLQYRIHKPVAGSPSETAPPRLQRAPYEAARLLWAKAG